MNLMGIPLYRLYSFPFHKNIIWRFYCYGYIPGDARRTYKIVKTFLRQVYQLYRHYHEITCTGFSLNNSSNIRHRLLEIKYPRLSQRNGLENPDMQVNAEKEILY